ncbi:MAG: phosphatidylserine decarboxylase family protein, partial [Candidatus Desulfofervidaceae bacterium]|nr:phosphatidylserine decarboxylase family protein [Candidatus Desulfofervidaceae bacterium]
MMHKTGWPFVIVSAFLSVMAIFLGWPLLAGIGGIFTLFFIYFFRDPERQIPLDPKVIVSPADGQVVFIGQTKTPFLDKKMKKISIFMSIFNVHVNRMPFDAKVEKIKYKKGKFLPAYKAEADTANEANAIFCSTQTVGPFIIVQIAGILARRIVCNLKPGQEVKKGERIG